MAPRAEPHPPTAERNRNREWSRSARSLLLEILLWLSRLLPVRLRRWLLLLPYREPQRRLLAARRSPAQVQRTALLRIIEHNKRTEFGRTHAFDQIRDPASFVSRVPLRSFAELAPYIQRQRDGDGKVLVEAQLIGLARSGGSRGLPRGLPVTAAGLEQWQWLEDLLLRQAISRRPEVAEGVTLQILPVFQGPEGRGRDAAGGSASDLPLLPMPVLAQRLGRGSRQVPEALPPVTFTVLDEATRYYLCLRLALSQPVTLLRAASPGTLTVLAEHLERMGPKLCDDLAAGRLDPPGELPEAVRRALPPLRPEGLLAASLRKVMEQRGRLEPRQVWPRLSLLVCSTTGPARSAASRLADRYGDLPLLDPGYRAAEAEISLPWMEESGGLVALGGQFLEFLPVGGDGATVMPEALSPGDRCQPVVTGPSGLYRYLMDDVVEVTRLEDGLPRLALAGRARCRLRLESGTLGEEEVREAVLEACRSCGVRLTDFTGWIQPSPLGAAAGAKAEADSRGWLARLLKRASAVASRSRPPVPALALALEPAQALETAGAERLGHALDSELGRRSHTYDEHRTQGNLGPPLVLVLRNGSFARRSHRRLADGASDGHAPVPALSDDGFVLDSEEVMLQV